MQIAFEEAYSRNGENLICDRGVYSVIPYSKFCNMNDAMKLFVTKTALAYAQCFPYDYVIYLEPLNTKKLDEKSKQRSFQMMIDREMRKIYEEHFTVGKNLFYVPVIEPTDDSKGALYEAKMKRAQHVLDMIEEFLYG